MMPAAVVYALASEDHRDALNRERARRLTGRSSTRAGRRPQPRARTGDPS